MKKDVSVPVAIVIIVVVIALVAGAGYFLMNRSPGSANTNGTGPGVVKGEDIMKRMQAMPMQPTGGGQPGAAPNTGGR